MAKGKTAAKRKELAASVETLGAEELRQLTGLTDRRHRQLAEEGYYPAPDRGRYRKWETLVGLIRYLLEQVHKKDDTLANQEKKLKAVRTEKLEIERDILKRLYVRREEIGPLLTAMGLQQKAVLQSKLENELPHKLAGQDPIEIGKRMGEVVDELCGIFAKLTIGESYES